MTMFAFDAIGTSWRIETGVALSPALRQRVVERIAAFDAVWSRFRGDSLVGAMAVATGGGTFRFPDEAVDLFALYDVLHRITAGAVDPLVGRDLELLGYDADYSLTPAIPAIGRSRPDWMSEFERDGPVLVTRGPVVLDIGAAGKGLLVDIVSDLLIDAGVERLAVDAGGDMKLIGVEPTPIGLEHPFDAALAVGVVTMGEGALCASGIGRRAWGDGLHHILDGRTGRPTHDVVATWVRADSAMTADGLATALFFVSADDLAGQFAFSHARMFADGRAEMAPDFGGDLFTS